MTAPRGSGFRPEASSHNLMADKPSEPSQPAAPSRAEYDSPVDLRAFQDLPPRFFVSSNDPAVISDYEKLSEYFRIDDPENGGNGDKILQAEEVKAYFKGRNNSSDAEALMKETRQFSGRGAKEFKEKLLGSGLKKDAYELYQTCTQNWLSKAVCGYVSLSVAGMILGPFFSSRRKGPPSPPQGGGGPYRKKASPPPIGDGGRSSHARMVAREPDLSAQIHRMYGSAVSVGSHPKAPGLLPSEKDVPTLSLLPLLTPVPVTVPEVRPVPVIRPVLVPVP